MTQDPNSPFNWRMRIKPRVVEDAPAVKPIDPKAREKELLAYKHFGVYSKAVASVKKPNKHEK